MVALAVVLFGSIVGAAMDPATAEIFNLGIGDSPPLPYEAHHVDTAITRRVPTTWHLVFQADLLQLSGGEACVLNRDETPEVSAAGKVSAVIRGRRCLGFSGARDHYTMDNPYTYAWWALLAGLAALSSGVCWLFAATLRTYAVRLTLAVAGGLLALAALLGAVYA